MMVLRSVVTLEISAIIGQAGWAAAWLGGEDRYESFHAAGAVVTLALTLLSTLVYLVLRRHAGPVNVILMLILAAAVVTQYVLGEAGVTAPHIFLGVLIAMTVTALTSWTYRHPDTAAQEGVPRS